MTKRDFEFIAASFRQARDEMGADIDAIETVDRTAQVFAARLAIANPLFNVARFLQACGVEA